LNQTIGGTGVIGIGGAAAGIDDFAGWGGSMIGGSGGGDGLVVHGGAPNGNGMEVFPADSGNWAALFYGNVYVGGDLVKSGGSFEIDDPIDPEGKYLYHSFVESPDMMNIYNGNVVTDGSGRAIITLPAYFQSLNTEFRYQLTTIGSPAKAWVATEVANNQFTIQTEQGSVKVSWQVTGVRQDPWANAHRIPNEVEKSEKVKGHYLHPELFGHAGERNAAEMESAHLPATQR
jgi:trimeric autotransporter adhesin